ncbi:MAG TPA: acyl-ACP desaturase [Pseudonocardiaceae bacterium]|nr:acyl-ACP desaturase [Pseudonocardiaceae bacterium]
MDENLHMVFYRSLVAACLEIDPAATVRAIHAEIRASAMQGTVIADFGRKARIIATSGIYNLRIHLGDVLWPLLRHWVLFDLTGLDGAAAADRDQFGVELSQEDIKDLPTAQDVINRFRDSVVSGH